MGNVKTGLKQRLEYVFPKEYNFYKKNLDVEDNKIFLKSNYCIDCVKEEDIWFKFYFMYGTQDSNNMCMNNLNGAGGNNKSDFKYILAGSGLRKIFDYHIDWSRYESMDVFEFTYPCILLAGLYLVGDNGNCIKNEKRIKADKIYAILDKLLSGYDKLKKNPEVVKNHIVPLTNNEICSFKNAVIKIKDSYIDDCDRSSSSKARKETKNEKTYSVKEKEKIIIQIKEITQEFIEEEKKMQEAYERIKKQNKLLKKKQGQAEKSGSSDIKSQYESSDLKYIQREQQWKETKKYYRAHCEYSIDEFWLEDDIKLPEDIDEQEEDTKEQEDAKEPGDVKEQEDIKEHVDVESVNDKKTENNFWKIYGENYFGIYDEREKEKILAARINAEYTMLVAEQKYSENRENETYGELEEDCNLVHYVDTIEFPPYLKPIFTVLAEYYHLFPLISKKSELKKSKSGYVGNPLMGKDMYNKLYKVRRMCDAVHDIDRYRDEFDGKFLKKYCEFYCKSHEKLVDMRKGIRKLNKTTPNIRLSESDYYSGEYLLEQIFALDLFYKEAQIIVNGAKKIGGIEILEGEGWDRLAHCLEKIYEIKSVYTRKQFAENILKRFFDEKAYQLDEYNWNVFRKSISRIEKTQHTYEEYKIMELFGSGSAYSDIAITTIKMNIKKAMPELYESPIGEWSEIKKKVKAISEKDRKTIEKIIIASAIKMWKLI